MGKTRIVKVRLCCEAGHDQTLDLVGVRIGELKGIEEILRVSSSVNGCKWVSLPCVLGQLGWTSPRMGEPCGAKWTFEILDVGEETDSE